MFKNIILTAVFIFLVSCDQSTLVPADFITSSSIVIGEESRQESTDLQDIYKRRTGQLLSKIKVGDKVFVNRCTATAIGENLIITAAHCAYDLNTNLLLTDLFFVPGMSKNHHMPYKRFRVLRTFHPNSYDPSKSLDSNTDMAIMIVSNNADNENLLETVGIHEIKGKKKFFKTTAFTVGYPGDKPRYHQFYEQNCPVKKSGKRKINIECDVYRGQSGSPIFVYSAKDQEYFIEGVISAEGSRMNYGTLVTSERHQIIDSIRNNRFHARDFKEKWNIYDHNPADTINVLFKNKCPALEDIYVTTFSFTEARGWEVKGPYSVAPDESIEFINSTNLRFEVNVRSKSGKIIESGPYLRSIKDGRSLSFKRFSVEEYGDYEIEYDCN